MHRYYSTERPIGPGTYPSGADIAKIENFDWKRNVEEIGTEAWGYLETKEPLTTKDILQYELIPSDSKIWYSVVTEVHENGKIVLYMGKHKRDTKQPENSGWNLNEYDVYTDWFGNKKEAYDFIRNNRQ